ncbi:transposase [Streptomyces sp. NPDC046557]|uniref:transposase n=1 Tax=Streptomyces sp. NPDC046557 TaxID=3155372 RepID=UPI0033F58C21
MTPGQRHCNGASRCRTLPGGRRTREVAEQVADQKAFRPRELRDLQLRVGAEQQKPEWQARYAVRSGVEGTINELAHGHGRRRCRYWEQQKAHLQHVLTATAANIEPLSRRPPTGKAPSWPPTAFQNFLDPHGIPRPRSWRSARDRADDTKIPDRVSSGTRIPHQRASGGEATP